MSEADPDRTVRLGDIVGPGDIAERLGVRPRTVLAWYYRYMETGFPSPHRVKGGYLWVWPDIEAWHRANRGGL